MLYEVITNLYAEILMDESRLEKLAANNIPHGLLNLLRESGVNKFSNHTDLFDFLTDLEKDFPELKKYRNEIYNLLNQWAIV